MGTVVSAYQIPTISSASVNSSQLYDLSVGLNFQSPITLVIWQLGTWLIRLCAKAGRSIVTVLHSGLLYPP